MADDNAKLLIVLEAQSKKLQNQLAQAQRTIDGFAAKTNRTFDQMNAKDAASFDSLNKKVGVSLGALQAGIAKAFAGAAALRGAQQLIDASTRIENSLKIAGLAGEELDKVYGELFDSAQRNATPVESLVDLYGKLAQSQKELGASQADLLSFTDNVAVALRVSGKSATESSGALLQLSQALAGGIVRAEEFNSIQEGALPINQAVAAGISEAGGSVAKLRQLVIDGKVSSEAYFRAFELGAGTIRDKVADAESTISQRFLRLGNVLIDVAGKLNNVSNASDILGSILDSLTDSIGGVGRAFERAMNPGAALVDDLAGRVSEAEGALRSFAEGSKGVFSPEVEAAFQDLINQVIKGRGTFESAKLALDAMGDADPKFDIVVGEVTGLIHVLNLLRGSAEAAKEAVSFSDIGKFPTAAAMAVFNPAPTETLSIEDERYRVTDTGSGRSGQSSADRYKQQLEDIRRRTSLLKEQTAIMRDGGPLVGDFGDTINKLGGRHECSPCRPI